MPTIDHDTALRPRSFADYIGQAPIIENLRRSVAAARRANRPLDHFLIAGPAGLGKTSLAQVIAAEMGAKLRITSGPAITHKGELASILTAIQPGDVLFIDEIHRLPVPAQELLYSAMEDFRLDLVVGKQALAIQLPRFTLLGATTHPGMLAAPLMDRFGFCWQLRHYEAADMLAIVQRSAAALGIAIDELGAAEIARRARGTPRIANRLLRRVRDFADAIATDLVITRELAAAALEELGVDLAGLTTMDRAYLELVCHRGPLGAHAIAQLLAERRDTIEQTIEPYLLHAGLVERTARGRIGTHAGYRHMGVALPLPRKAA